MSMGLTFVRGREQYDTVEADATTRVPGQFSGYDACSVHVGTTNEWTNPRAGSGETTGVLSSGMNTITAVTFADEGIANPVTGGMEITTGFKVTYQDDQTLAYQVLTLIAARHAGTMLVYMPSSWDGGDCFFQMEAGFVSAEVHAVGAALASVPDVWQSIESGFVPDAGDLTGTPRLWTDLAPTIGRTLYLTAVQVEHAPHPTPYCDGSLGPGHRWTGAPHASTSVREAGRVRLPGGGRNAARQLVGNPVFGHSSFLDGYIEVQGTGAPRAVADGPLRAFGIDTALSWRATSWWSYPRYDVTEGIVDGAPYVMSVVWRRRSGTPSETGLWAFLLSGGNWVPGSVPSAQSLSLPADDRWYLTAMSFEASAIAQVVDEVQVSPHSTHDIATSGEVEIAYVGLLPLDRTFGSNALGGGNYDGKQPTYLHEVFDPTDSEHLDLVAVGGMAPGYTWEGEPHASPTTRTAVRAPSVSGFGVGEQESSCVIWWTPGHDAVFGPQPPRLLDQRDGPQLFSLHHDSALGRYELSAADAGAQATVAVDHALVAAQPEVAYAAIAPGEAVELAIGGGAIVSQETTVRPVLTSDVDVGSLGGFAQHIEGSVAAVAWFDRRLSQEEWTYFAALGRPPLMGERVGAAMRGLWLGGHSVGWRLSDDGDAVDFMHTPGALVEALHGTGLPPIEHRSVSSPVRDGAVRIDALHRPRTVQMTLVTSADDGADWWELRRRLARALNSRESGGVLQYAPAAQIYEIDAVVAGGARFDYGAGGFARTTTLAFRCDQPAWRGPVQNERRIVLQGGGMAVETALPMSLAPLMREVEIANDGDYAVYPEVRWRIAGRATEAPFAERVGAARLTASGRYEPGEVITADMEELTMTDGGGQNLFGRREGKTWALSRGNNTVRVGAAAGDVVARLRWPTRYAGV